MKKISGIILGCIVIILLLGILIFFKTNKYTVGFYIDDQLVQKVETKKGIPIEEPDAPKKDGWMFLGWYTEEGERFNFGYGITKNIKLIAYWAEITDDTSLEE